jgi:hypothetical protein
VTNDGATILSLLDIEHPAGKILVDLAQQQDKEVSVTHFPSISLIAKCWCPFRSETEPHLSF